MRVAIRQKNFTITPALRTYIEQKLLKPIRRSMRGVLERELPILDLEFYRRTAHHKKGSVYHAEANLSLGKKIIRAKSDSEDMRSAVDLLEEKLERGITTFEGRANALYKRRALAAKKESHLSSAARMYRKGRMRDEGI